MIYVYHWSIRNLFAVKKDNTVSYTETRIGDVDTGEEVHSGGRDTHGCVYPKGVQTRLKTYVTPIYIPHQGYWNSKFCEMETLAMDTVNIKAPTLVLPWAFTVFLLLINYLLMANEDHCAVIVITLRMYLVLLLYLGTLVRECCLIVLVLIHPLAICVKFARDDKTGKRLLAEVEEAQHRLHTLTDNLIL